MIKVGGLTAKVRVVEDVGAEAKVHGEMYGYLCPTPEDSTTTTILVRRDKRAKTRAQTLLHEMAHLAVLAARRKAPVKSEEDYVLAFEQLCDQLWKDGWRPKDV